MKPHHSIVIRSQRPKVIIKPLGIRHAFDDRLTIGDIPLTNTGRLIAHLANQFRPSDLRSRHPPAFAPKWLTSSQERRAGRPANRLGIKRTKLRPFLRQLVKTRSPILLTAVTSEVAVSLIVSKNDHDVRSLSSFDNSQNSKDQEYLWNKKRSRYHELSDLFYH